MYLCGGVIVMWAMSPTGAETSAGVPGLVFAV